MEKTETKILKMDDLLKEAMEEDERGETVELNDEFFDSFLNEEAIKRSDKIVEQLLEEDGIEKNQNIL